MGKSTNTRTAGGVIMDKVNYTNTQINRFWSKVDKRTKTQCWNWLGAKTPGGYGNVRINAKYFKSHRVAWEITHFKIPGNMVICHACDNPSCCNPHHLMLGTQSSNVRDCLVKGRRRSRYKKGVNIPKCEPK